MEDDDENANAGEMDDYEFDMGEDDASQQGGADGKDSDNEDSKEEATDAESAAETDDSAKDESARDPDSEPESDNEVLATPTLPLADTMSINSQAQQALQPQMAPLPSTTTTQSFPSNQSIPNQPVPQVPNMQVSPIGAQIGGIGDDSQVDLSQYGGVKPDFDVIEREDEKAIENLNAKLLGMQTGGQNESLEQAKQQGIESIISNQQPVNMPSPSQLIQPAQPAMRPSGLNFSFNQQVAPTAEQSPSYQPQLSMQQASMQQASMQQAPMQQSAGGESQKQVSFNNDIKVVELDTKISEGFLYSGSKNLDPFGQ